MMPWLAFIFVGVLDFGFYSYAAICTESAARVAAEATSASVPSATWAIACPAVLSELKGLPNVTALTGTSCGMTSSVTNAVPVAVVVNLLSCSTVPQAADCTAHPVVSPQSSQVIVTYLSIPMIPIPGAMMGRMTLNRVSEMRISQ